MGKLVYITLLGLRTFIRNIVTQGLVHNQKIVKQRNDYCLGSFYKFAVWGYFVSLLFKIRKKLKKTIIFRTSNLLPAKYKLIIQFD